MAAPTVHGFGAIASVGLLTTITVPKAASQLADDVTLVMAMESTLANTFSATGWTQLATWDRTIGERFWVMGRRHTAAAEADPVFDRSATGRVFARAMTIRGAASLVDAWEVIGSTGTASADPLTIPGITTLTAESLVVACYAYQDDNGTTVTMTGTDPAAYTENFADTNLGSDGGIGFGYAARTAAGATGDVTAGLDVAFTAGRGAGGVLIAIRPPAAGAPGETVSAFFGG